MTVLAIPSNIKRIITSPRNIVITSIVVLLLIVTLNIILNKENKGSYSSQESLIAPTQIDNSLIKKSDPDFFKRTSLQNAIAIERYMYDWSNIFNIFASNPENQKFRYSLNTPVLEKLSGDVRENPVFYTGTSDAVLKEYGSLIKEECNYYKLDYRLVLAMIKQESAFISDAVSHAGAYGFMQIMPRTGSALEQILQLEEHNSPKNNLIAGIYYYATLVGRYNSAGDTNKYCFALAAYNAGSGHVEDAMSIAYYNHENYLSWNIVKERIKQLAPDSDSVHKLVWGGRPPNGTLANWKEPYNYVSRIMYYWEQYKLYYPEPGDKKVMRKSKKKK